MKIDPHHNQQKYEKWRKKGVIKGISQANSDIIVQYLIDMENGFNSAGRRPVSFFRLNTLRMRMGYIARNIEQLYGKRVVDVTDREVVSFFKSMRDGAIRKSDGKQYISVPDYVSVFKAFWHWYQRVENEKGNTIKDITTYIDTSPVQESRFVYFTIDQLRKMANRAKFNYKVMMWFMFDSGIRSPTELSNIRISDLSMMDGGHYQLDIRNEISKTFGRKIKLLLCSKILSEYIEDMRLAGDDYLFEIIPRVVNQYLKRIAVKVFGNEKTKGGKYWNEIGVYDFRHASACYWLPLYKQESALKYRFGWKHDKMIHHYTKLLGMRDTISEEDLIETEAKTKLEKELAQERGTRELLQEQLKAQQTEMQEIRSQLQKSASRDQFILKLLQRIDNSDTLIKALKGGLDQELALMD
ncbi:MAG: hypothetical protein ABH879_08050 [archaeon]